MKREARILELKQRLRAWSEALSKLPPRQRLLVLGGAGFVLVLLLYVLLLSPLLDLKDNWAQQLDQKAALLHKLEALEKDKQAVFKAYENMQKTLTRVDGQLLTGTNPAVASADLQEILKNLTRNLGVQVTSTKVLPPQESGAYLEVPIEVQMNCTIDQLVSMLYRLEHHEKLLLITELDINAPRVRRRRGPQQDDSTLRAHLVVEGLMKKGAG